MTAAVIVTAPITSATMMPMPPAAQPSGTGSDETSTTASPPRATKPMIPVLNSPAKPHCMFTPNAITADNSPRLRIDSDRFQLWNTPVAI